MEARNSSWYSIIRYCPDNLAGEVVNVGVVLHSIDSRVITKYQILNENSPKLRAITQSDVDLNIYKSFKDSLEYYLEKSSSNLMGMVGKIEIGSPQQEKFLETLYDYYKGKKLSISRPTFSLSNDIDGLFNAIFESYVGKKYINTEIKDVSVKKYMKNIFEDKGLLDKKVIHDYVITPIKELASVKIQIDFGYKNGVWNYLQAVPNISIPSRNTEWFAKTKFMFENLTEKDAKVHLMYRTSEFQNNRELNNTIDYLTNLNSRIIKLDLDNEREIGRLVTTIENDAHNLSDLKIS